MLLKFLQKKKKSWDYNINKLICYNCNKKNYYANTCIKFLKKLIKVLVISVAVIDSGKKVIFKKIPYIYYLFWFYNNKI